MEPQKTLLFCQSNLGKEEQYWRYHNFRFQTILKSYSNQNNMVLEKNRHRSIAQNRETEMNPHLHSQLTYGKGGNIHSGGK